MELQHCARCSKGLPLDAYHPGKQGKPGTYCRQCALDYKREWRRANGQRTRAEHVASIRRRCACPGCDRAPTGKTARYCIECREAARLEAASAPTYGTVHIRLREARGRAVTHDCVGCGAPAEEWAYDHADPNELSQIRKGRAVRYSADFAHYKPMCKPCHSRFDARDSELRKPCMGPDCDKRVLPPFDYCSGHRPTAGPGRGFLREGASRGRRPGDGLDAEITALVLERAGQASDVCRRCKAEKPVAEFSRDKRRPKGYITVCRPCASAVSLERYRRRKLQAST